MESANDAGEPLPASLDERKAGEAFYKFQNDVREILYSNIRGGTLKTYPEKDEYDHLTDTSIKKDSCIKLSDFSAWAKGQKNFKCPQELLNTDAPDNREHPKVVDSLLKMVFAMATDCYGYDPADKKSTVTADIQNALEKCNLPLSDNTIRTRLKEAAEIVDRSKSQ
jgi:hypothetical protein